MRSCRAHLHGRPDGPADLLDDDLAGRLRRRVDGRFDWSAPDEEVHAAANDLMRPIRTHLYGRRLWEVMSAWQTRDTRDEPPVIADFAALRRAADKVVVSSTLESVSTPRTRLERRFDPDAVAGLVRAAPHDVLLGGPGR